MSLIPSHFGGFNNYTHNLGDVPSTSLVGTRLTGGANNLTLTPVNIVPALTHDVHFISIGFAGFSANGANGQVLVDILLDYSGGTNYNTLFISGLVCGFSIAFTSAALNNLYQFPIYIPSGASIGARAQTRHTSNLAGHCVVHLFGNPRNPEGWWYGTNVESLTINTGISQGVTVTPGNAVYGNWTNIGTSTERYRFLQVGLNGSDGTSAAQSYFWQIGVSGTGGIVSSISGAPLIYSIANTTEQALKIGMGVVPIWCDFPSGTIYTARGMASASPEAYNMAIYGVI